MFLISAELLSVSECSCFMIKQLLGSRQLIVLNEGFC